MSILDTIIVEEGAHQEDGYESRQLFNLDGTPAPDNE